jgi:hypothetical protein
MQNKFTKFDIGSFEPKNPRRKISRREVLTMPQPAKILPKRKFKAQLGSFIAACMCLVLLLQGGLYLSAARNAKGEILGAATSAYGDLSSAGKNLGHEDLSSAKGLFESAQANVKLAQDKLNNFKPLTWIAPQANSADHVLAGASYLAAAGSKLTEALALFEEFKVSHKGVETANFDDRLAANRQLLIDTKTLVQKSSDEFANAGSVPLDYSNTLDTARQQVTQLNTILGKLIGLEDLYINIFGGSRTYLLIFQNYDEARATGGFIGTYGVLEASRGKIDKLNIDSIYNLDGQIYEQIAAPGPMQPDIARWGIRDANWFADFPASAQKLLYFFEKGRQTADGVISATPKIFEDLLRLVGPIEMKDYNVTLTADNFQEIVQYKTSEDYNRTENQPKKMLSDFAPILLDRLANLPKDQWFNFFQIMQDNLNQRQALVYSKDPAVEKTIEDLGFSGKILPADFDYLNIVNSNLGGTKTDLKMDQTAKLQSKILSDGSIFNTLTVNRANKNSEPNKDYMRILVPPGSQFISAKGFDPHPVYASVAKNLRTDPDLAAWDVGEEHDNIFVRSEAGKAEFAGWINTEPGEEKSITVNYILPFKIAGAFAKTQPYSLILQKQAGGKPYNFEGTLSLGKYKVDWTSSAVEKLGNSLNFSSNTNTDDFWGFVLIK